MKTVHTILKEIRKSLHMSQEEVAQALHIQTTTYSKIERGAIQLTVNRLLDLSRVFGLSPEELLTWGKPRKQTSKTPPGNITYVPVHAQAGFLDHYADQTVQEKFTTFHIPVFTEKDLFMISVEGDSMYPTIHPGTFIIIREVTNRTFIKWGEPHVLVTPDGRVVKRVLQSGSPEHLTLHSDNKLYPPYDIPNTYILSLWQVLGTVSRSFTSGLFFGQENGS